MARLLVLYHSATGNTKAMADLIAEGARAIEDTEVAVASIDEVSKEQIESADALAVGSPTYYGTMSWQMKQFMDTFHADFAGKLAAPFASANWPGGGGYEFTEMALIAALLIKGAMIYTGGVVSGPPPTHFGAVSKQSPEGFDADRCRKLGRTLAQRARELFD